MANDKAVLLKDNNLDVLDFDDLERILQNDNLETELKARMSELSILNELKEQINKPEALGKDVLNIVLEQFNNQISIQAGIDFKRMNNGLYLDLSDEAHIQTTENFAKGKIASHNTEIDYNTRYSEWQNNFQKNADGSIKTKIDYRNGEEKAVLRVKDYRNDPSGTDYNKNYDAREFIDKGRPMGSKIINKDHVISAAEIIRDPETATHMAREEQAAFANSEKNLVDLDSAANQSKSDSKMTDWLDSERNGEKPADRFNISEKELRQKDKAARLEYEKLKRVAKQKSIELGKKSQKLEALRVSEKTIRAIVINLLSKLAKDIIRGFVYWLKSVKKTLKSLLRFIEEAILTFISDLKHNVINVFDTMATTIATSIIGPIVSTVKKAWMLIKQGWSILKEAILYIGNPNNEKKSISELVMGVGEIIISGLPVMGGVVLSGVIEKGLSAIPLFNIEIPFFGSIASVIGIFMGAMIAGIIGAIVLNLITRVISKRYKGELVKKKINKCNDILIVQEKLEISNKYRLLKTKNESSKSIKKRHDKAHKIVHKALKNITKSLSEDDNSEELAAIDKKLDVVLLESREEEV